ncbi:MAG: hypothetical protein M1147_08950 [Nitrospirae bacterium]|nr:hypothetical protein [Nitrospirota bacterium]MCL5978227.1 hypothetical protein [Nitrospirota bacterium]
MIKDRTQYFRSFSKGIQPFSEATPARLDIHVTLGLPKPLQYNVLPFNKGFKYG